MTEYPTEVWDLIQAALKYDDERNGGSIDLDTRPDLADAAARYREAQLPALPDRWARIYPTHTANPSWNTFEEAAEAQRGQHIAVVRYIAVRDSVRFIGGAT